MMHLRILAALIALACTPAFAQVTPGSGPLTGAKGGTNNSFMQFTGPASSLKTYTLPNASGTIDLLNSIQTFTAAKTFNDLTLLLAGSSSGTTTLKASAAASGVLTLPAATDTLVGRATTDILTGKTYDTAGSGNVFKINGLAANDNTGTGKVVRDTNPTLTGPTIAAIQSPANVSILNGAAAQGLNASQLCAAASFADCSNTPANGIYTKSGIFFPGSTSGSISLVAPAISGASILTLPAATDTLVGKSTPDTMANKTLTAPVINSPTGIVKGDVGLGNVDNTSDATKNAATASLTNKNLTSGTNTFPTLNQNTTGSSAKLTTARNIDGQAFDGTANVTVIAPGTHSATSKATPVDADELPLVDSAASNVLKKLTWANLKVTIKTYYDSLSTTLSNKTFDTASNTFRLNGAAFGTATQATSALNAMVGDSGSGGTKGLVPAPAAGDAAAGKFLRADGLWAAGSGGGGGGDVTGPATNSDSFVPQWDGSNTKTLKNGLAVGTGANKIPQLDSNGALLNAVMGASSIGSSGYYTLPGGLIVQWGPVGTPTSGVSTTTFPVAFPNSVFSVVVGLTFATGAAQANSINTYNISTSGFNAKHMAGSTPSAIAGQYIAIGN